MARRSVTRGRYTATLREQPHGNPVSWKTPRTDIGSGLFTVDSDIGFFMTEADAVTVCVKDMAGVSPVSVGLRWVEEW